MLGAYRSNEEVQGDQTLVKTRDLQSAYRSNGGRAAARNPTGLEARDEERGAHVTTGRAEDCRGPCETPSPAQRNPLQGTRLFMCSALPQHRDRRSLVLSGRWRVRPHHLGSGAMLHWVEVMRAYSDEREL